MLVLGATGFIGRWVARHLDAAGADVTLVARQPASLDAEFANCTVIQADLLDFDSLPALVSRVSPAIVFNLAGYGVDRSERDATIARGMNTDLLPVLVQAMSRVAAPGWQGQRIVHTGSALEYGTSSGDLDETTATEPDTLYGQTKLAGTLALQTRSRAAGLSSVTARLFTVYGPGEHDGRLLPSLLGAAQCGKPVQLTSGAQQRDFTYVEDVVEGLLRLGTAQTAAGDIVNLATGKLATVREFIETAARILGIPTEHLLFGALSSRTDDMAHQPVTIRKLKTLTGWFPDIAIEQGIERTCSLVKQQG